MLEKTIYNVTILVTRFLQITGRKSVSIDISIRSAYRVFLIYFYYLDDHQDAPSLSLSSMSLCFLTHVCCFFLNHVLHDLWFFFPKKKKKRPLRSGDVLCMKRAGVFLIPEHVCLTFGEEN